MRFTIKPWAVLLCMAIPLCASALAGCTVFPATRNDTLNAVSCFSANSCVAVGSTATVTGQTQTITPAAMRWDGSRWSALNVQMPSGGVQGQLSSVSCTSGKCLAVGSYSTKDLGFLALAEYWNDSTWTGAPLAFPPGPPRPSLQAISCVPAGQCVATGSYGKFGSFDSALAVAWDGRAWSWSRPPVRTFGPPGNRILASVSCLSAEDCVAIGNAYDSASDTAGGFTETWNGHGWTYTPGPGGAGAVAGLSCAAPAYCAVAGTQFAGDAAGYGQVLHGTRWTGPTMPWPGGIRSYMYGVSCAGKSCLAVGEAGPSQAANGTYPAALTWNGVTWIRQATAKGIIGTLYGVTCVTVADCVAVGSARGGNGTTTLSEIWNGKAWTTGRPGPA